MGPVYPDDTRRSLGPKGVGLCNLGQNSWGFNANDIDKAHIPQHHQYVDGHNQPISGAGDFARSLVELFGVRAAPGAPRVGHYGVGRAFRNLGRMVAGSLPWSGHNGGGVGIQFLW